MRPSRSTLVLLWTLTILDAALIFFLSSRPRPTDDLPPGDLLEAIYHATPAGDKIVHFLSFLLFGFLLSLSMVAHARHLGRKPGDRDFVIAFLAALLYAATDEIHQHFVPPRTPELGDFLVDGAGALLAAGLVRWRSLRPRSAVGPHPGPGRGSGPA